MIWVFVLYSHKPLRFAKPMTLMLQGTKNDMLDFPVALMTHLHTFYEYIYYVECSEHLCPVLFDMLDVCEEYAAVIPSGEVRVVNLGLQGEKKWGVHLKEELLATFGSR